MIQPKKPIMVWIKKDTRKTNNPNQTLVSKKIRRIARLVRKSCEIYVANRDKFKDDRIDTNCHRELDCFCAISSAFLQRILKYHKISAKIVTGQYQKEEHAWVETTVNIIDLTLTQFKKASPASILPKNTFGFEKEAEGTNLKKLFEGWPDSQLPTRKRLQRLKKIYLQQIQNVNELHQSCTRSPVVQGGEG